MRCDPLGTPALVTYVAMYLVASYIFFVQGLQKFP